MNRHVLATNSHDHQEEATWPSEQSALRSERYLLCVLLTNTTETEFGQKAQIIECLGCDRMPGSLPNEEDPVDDGRNEHEIVRDRRCNRCTNKTEANWLRSPY